MTVDELLAGYQKNTSFYKKGGITATGGEPLMQLDFLTTLFKKAKEQTYAALCQNPTPALKYFMEHFLPGFELTLDELN